MFRPMSRNEMRSPTARTAAFGTLAHCTRDSRVPRKTEIIVAGEVDERPPVDDGRYTTARLHKSVDRPPLTTKMLTIELCECGLNRRRPAPHLSTRSAT